MLPLFRKKIPFEINHYPVILFSFFFFRLCEELCQVEKYCAEAF